MCSSFSLLYHTYPDNQRLSQLKYILHNKRGLLCASSGSWLWFVFYETVGRRHWWTGDSRSQNFTVKSLHLIQPPACFTLLKLGKYVTISKVYAAFTRRTFTVLNYCLRDCWFSVTGFGKKFVLITVPLPLLYLLAIGRGGAFYQWGRLILPLWLVNRALTKRLRNHLQLTQRNGTV